LSSASDVVRMRPSAPRALPPSIVAVLTVHGASPRFPQASNHASATPRRPGCSRDPLVTTKPKSSGVADTASEKPFTRGIKRGLVNPAAKQGRVPTNAEYSTMYPRLLWPNRMRRVRQLDTAPRPREISPNEFANDRSRRSSPEVSGGSANCAMYQIHRETFNSAAACRRFTVCSKRRVERERDARCGHA
jgi:hypothetical protein